MFNPNIFNLPVMPAQIYGQHILPKFRFIFMKNVNIQNCLSYVVPVESKVKIWQNFVAFSEYMNFDKLSWDWLD